MRKFWIIVAAVLVAALPSALLTGTPADSLHGGSLIRMEGTFLRQLQKRDSILIADQLLWGVPLGEVADDTDFMFPEIKDIGDTLIVVRPWQIDTLSKKGGKKHRIRRLEAGMVITSFEEGKWKLPEIPVLRVMPDGRVDTLLFEGVEMDIRTMPVDTATFVVHDIKGQIGYPVTLMEILPYVLGVEVLAGLVVLVVWLIRRRRRKEEIAAKKDPAHIVALRRLDAYRSDKFWAPEKQKQFYSGVTDALREYISARYRMNAMESTTAEIFSELKSSDIPAELYVDLKELFERSDFVKFAKMTVEPEQNATVLPLAVRFVTSTYERELEQESQKAEKEGR